MSLFCRKRKEKPLSQGYMRIRKLGIRLTQVCFSEWTRKNAFFSKLSPEKAKGDDKIDEN